MDAVRYGVIGTGMMGCEHIANIEATRGAEVAAVSDPTPKSLEWAREWLGERGDDVAYGADHRSILEDPTIDAVVIASPNHTHIDVLRDALRSDKHLLIEKPLCTTVPDCLEVQELAEGREPLTWVALEYRFMPTIAVLLDQVGSGVCGDVRMVSIREHRFPFLDKVGNWNRFTSNTGGTLVEKCCHFFDLMCQIAGARPTLVYASGGQDVNHLDEVYDGRPADILDNALVTVEFANGVRGHLDLCMFAEGGRFEQELSVVGSTAKLEATVPGDTVWLGRRHEPGQEAIDAAPDPALGYEGFHHGASFVEHRHFLRCIEQSAPAEVPIADGLWSVAMGAAAHRSIDEGRPVGLREFGLEPTS